jgi:outer membrane protein assembly factor BamB
MPNRSTILLCAGILAQTLLAGGEETRRFAVADSSKGRLAIIAENGETEWEYKIGPLHDLHVLDNGHLLFQTDWTRIVEIDPASNRLIWEYDARKSPGNENRRVEVHAFQRLADGNTMIVESGAARILEVDSRGFLRKELKLQVAKPHPHHDTRLVRKLDTGHYLVCHEAEGRVTEYAVDGKVVWDYEVPLFDRPRKPGHGTGAFGNQCFSALRLESGNTLIGTGNGHSLIEVTPGKKTVWKLEQNDLPGIQLAWVTTLEVLPGGNIVIGNCHAGPDNPQLIEITRGKQVVWTFRDFDRFGDATTNSQILSANGRRIESSIR